MQVTTNPTRRPGTWRILRASPACGGRYAWARVRPSGALEMQGCVCHHPWTLALRAGGGSVTSVAGDERLAATALAPRQETS